MSKHFNLPDDWSWRAFEEYYGDIENEVPESPEDYAERLRDNEGPETFWPVLGRLERK